MATVDWLIILAYFAALAGLTWWVLANNKETAEDYFLAGRGLGWFIVGASIFASNIGSEHLVGLAGAGATSEKDGKVIGSALIGQEFKDDKYFHGRPSATLGPDPTDSAKTVSAPYNAANSGGSNLGPTSKALNDRVKEDVEKLKAENPSAAVPVDLVTTSPSGLDPDISPEGALFQVPRVAKARNMPEDRVRQFVAASTQGRFAGLLGEPRVNVLALNLALDAASK
jgi:K+-transporting ATPase ATPase C chain